MKNIIVVVCLALMMAVITPFVSRADTAAPESSTSTPDWKQMYEEQKKRTDDLERRLSVLEDKSTQDVYVVKEQVPESTLKFLKQTELDGYVSASYFYNFNQPDTHENAGRGFDARADEFMANKAVVRIGHPIDYSAFDWLAGYSVKLIFGQDAEFTQASGLSLGNQGDLFEANVTVNIPVGNGLKMTLGKFGTTMGYESTFTEENFNWSAGNLWTFVEPFTHTGVLLSYQATSELELKVTLNNGWDVVTDNNSSKSVMGTATYTLNDKTSMALTGYGGPEQDNNNSNWRKGVDFWIDQKFSPKLEGVAQIDYGAEDGADFNGKKAEWFGFGGWLVYTVNDKWNVATRADYLKDGDGTRTSDAPSLAPFPVNHGQELTSVTLTVNFRPVEALRLAPEFRWDHSSLSTAFDGHDTQVTVGMGAAYFY
ncbi:MAG TPA: outer membrane beta-barrel protein [Verrucomicrobiae bacterium]|nr:outer membrane beta-barrel protein [Verrucomicrobiae bacterium]